jgi:SAM-dependent methyltransferase
MHQGNREWLAHAQKTYGHNWSKIGVLELGSLDVNGSARGILRAPEYVGVDRVAGPGVDIVVDAEHTAFKPQSFGCLLCTSVLEHTPRWREILDHNLQWLRSGGILLLSWGAEGNQHHAPEPWAPVPVGDVLEWLMRASVDVIGWPLRVFEANWERSDCAGCYDIIARLE